MQLVEPNILQVKNLQYSYRRRRRLFRDLSVSFASGRTLLLGPNGAGKSTLLRLIAGIQHPQRGRILFRGNSLRTKAEFADAIGYMPQQVCTVPGLSVTEQVAYAAWLKGLSTASAELAARTALEMVGLAHKAGERAGRLSGGELRRVGLAECLVGQTGAALLDEPAAGLDPMQRARLRETINALEMPVVVSTHQVDDIAGAFDHVVVLDEGRVRFHGAVVDLLAYDRVTASAERAYINLMSGSDAW